MKSQIGLEITSANRGADILYPSSSLVIKSRREIVNWVVILPIFYSLRGTNYYILFNTSRKIEPGRDWEPSLWLPRIGRLGNDI